MPSDTVRTKGHNQQALIWFGCPQVEETVRSAKGTGAEVLAFHWPWFDDDCDRKPGQPKMPSGALPLPPALQATVISAAYSAGADGVVLWDCAKFMARGAGAGSKAVIEGSVGPVARAALTEVCRCASEECAAVCPRGGRGRELNVTTASSADAGGVVAANASAGGGCVCGE